jgi:hypothetical protein
LKIFSVNIKNFRIQSIAGVQLLSENIKFNTDNFYIYSSAIKNQLIGGQNSEINPSVSTMDNEHIPHRELRQMQTQVMERKFCFVYHSQYMMLMLNCL